MHNRTIISLTDDNSWQYHKFLKQSYTNILDIQSNKVRIRERHSTNNIKQSTITAVNCYLFLTALDFAVVFFAPSLLPLPVPPPNHFVNISAASGNCCWGWSMFIDCCISWTKHSIFIITIRRWHITISYYMTIKCTTHTTMVLWQH